MTGTGSDVAAFRRVVKSYGDIRALDDIDLAIAPGQVTALLGPNGAGKSTALEMLVGLRRPDSGAVTVFGADPRLHGSRRRMGVTPQLTDFPPGATPREILHLVSCHYETPVNNDDLMVRLGLGDVAGRPTAGFSGGQKRLLALACAFAGDPGLIVLDEPTTALDVSVRRAVWDEISRQSRDGRAVLLTTHALEEAEHLADRIVVFQAGKIIADGTVPEIAARAGARRVSFVAAKCPDFGPGADVLSDGDRRRVLTADADDVVRRLVLSRISFCDLEVSRASLEEAFIALTTASDKRFMSGDERQAS